MPPLYLLGVRNPAKAHTKNAVNLPLGLPDNPSH